MFPKEYTKTDKWCGYKEKLKGSNPYISGPNQSMLGSSVVNAQGSDLFMQGGPPQGSPFMQGGPPGAFMQGGPPF